MDFTGERFIPEATADGELAIEHYQRYQAVVELVKKQTVLDAASGEGYGSELLARHARLVCGLEIDPQAVTLAQAKYQRPNLHYTQGSVAALPFPDSTFDRVVSFETIEHIGADLQVAFLDEIKRVLKPDGLLVISTPDKLVYSDQPRYRNEFHRKEFYRQEFYDFLASRFPTVKFWEQRAVLAYLLTNGREEWLRQSMRPEEPAAGKYIVALCSPTATLAELTGTIVLDREDLHQQKVARVVALQEEVDEKNEIIWARDRTINQNADEFNARIKSLGHELGQAHTAIAQLQAQLAECQAAGARHQAEDDQRLRDLTACQNQLRHIYATRGYRIVQSLYRLKSKLPF